MFHPLSVYIGFRYTRAKRRNHFISFISLASLLGIALGVMILVVVLSVMNGFDDQIKNRIFAVVPQVTVSSLDNISDWPKLAGEIQAVSPKISIAPFVGGQAMLSNAGEVAGIYFTGVLPAQENQVSAIAAKMLTGNMLDLKPNKFGIVLGADLAAKLGVTLGDPVTLVTPEASVTPIGVVPRFKRFNVVGIFRIGGGFGFDTSAAFVHLNDAQKLLQLDNKISGLRIKVSDLYAAPELNTKLSKTLPGNYLISDWTREYGPLFSAISMEKTMMFVILLFIIAVAAFNLIVTLVMAVTDKQADIAILRTLGASPKTIMSIFIVQGCIVGFWGTFLGLISGILLAVNASAIVSGIEQFFHVHFISSSIYFIDYLPSKLLWSDVWHVGLVAMIMSLLATLYPAWRAAQTNPAEALRYD